MKTTLTFIFILAFSVLYSQDTLKIKQIDALVSGINASALPVEQDTLIQDLTEMGLKMTTYLTMMVNGGELIKYVNHVNSTMTEKGVTRQITTSNAFYYNHNKLIKVEEYLTEAGERATADWYYWEDKPVYYTLQSDRAESRSTFLLALSKTMLSGYLNRKRN